MCQITARGVARQSSGYCHCWFYHASAGFAAEEQNPTNYGQPNLQLKLLWLSLLLRRDGNRAHEEGREDPSTMSNWRIGKYCALTQTLKTLQFQVVQSKWENLVYSPYAIFGIGKDGARVEDNFSSSICLMGLLRNLWESWRLSSRSQFHEDKTKVLVTCGNLKRRTKTNQDCCA